MLPAIQIEGLGKRYRLGEREPYRAIRDLLASTVSAPLRWIGARQAPPTGAPRDGFIWALRQVSLEIAPGEVIGIIGRNGAGKTTLLKILSRITEPTEGLAVVRGRVGSLLEVGTGFHPELTGRENVYLNGAILGMHRAEIDRKFDEIVAFAEIAPFIDTPVKRYSSGMYVRLAFAVAAHLEPEILLVDEVLAVGDAAFRAKSLGKMGDISQRGRTVLFVSHNMGAVQRLCTRVYLLDAGRVVMAGEPAPVVDAYYEAVAASSTSTVEGERVIRGDLGFVAWSMGPDPTAGRHVVFAQDPCDLSFALQVGRALQQVYFGLALYASDGTLMWAMRSQEEEGGYADVTPGRYAVRFSLPSLPVRPGRYRLRISANTLTASHDEWHAEPMLTVLPRGESGLPPRWQGVLSLDAQFALERLTPDAEIDG